MSTAVSIRLSDEIAYELEGLTMTTERSRMYISRKSIESYLQEYVDYSVAIERLNDNYDEIISSYGVWNRFAL